MQFRALRWAALLVCVFACVACGSSQSGSTSPTPTPTQAPLSSLPSAGKVIATLPGIGGAVTPGYTYSIAVDDTAVWVRNTAQATVVRVDPMTNKVVATIPVGHGVGPIQLGAGFLWVINHEDGTVSK